MRPSPEQRREIEARVLLAALKTSMEQGDLPGASLAHRELSLVLQQKNQVDTFDGTEDFPPETQERFEIEDEPEDIAAEAEDYTQQETVTDNPADTNISSIQPEGEAEEPAEIAEPAEAAEPVEAVESVEDAEPSEAAEPVEAVVPVEAAEPAQTAEPAEAVEQVVHHVSEEVPTGNLYELLAANPKSTFEMLHVQFLRKIRKLLADRSNRDTSVWQFRDDLRALCVAHDILRDPVTRTDYDFRLLGLRGESQVQKVGTPDDMPMATTGNRPPLRIGELLQCSDVIDQKELEIAVDMHKAMPEMPFGQFLVKQDFLTQPELDSALLGQRLITDGKITVAQFQVAMYSVRADGTALGDALVTRGWTSQEDVDARTQEDPWAQRILLRETPRQPPVMPEFKTQTGETEARAQSAIAASNAVPSWAGQLDWGSDDEPEDGETSQEAPAEPKAVEEETTDFALVEEDEKAILHDTLLELPRIEPPESLDKKPVTGQHKILGTIIDTSDGAETWESHLSSALEAAALAQHVTIELDESPVPEELRLLLSEEESRERETDPAGGSDHASDEIKAEAPPVETTLDEAAAEPRLEESLPEVNADESTIESTDQADESAPAVPLQSLQVSLQEALSLEIQRFEREATQSHKEAAVDSPPPAVEEPPEVTEPSLDTGELEPPPWPGELKPAVPARADKAAGKSKKERRTTEQARPKRSKPPADSQSELADFDKDV